MDLTKKILLSYNFGQTDPFTIEEDIKVELSDGSSIFIPKGFNTDLSSSPRWLWSLFPPIGDFIIASVVHDYLYSEDVSRGRLFADKEMLLISYVHNKSKVDNYLRFLAVRVFGKKYFNKKRPPISR